MFDSFSNSAKIGLAGLALLVASTFTSGCNGVNARGKSNLYNLGMSYVNHAVTSSAQKRFGPQQITNVVVNNTQREYRRERPKPRIKFNEWFDFNGDGKCEISEVGNEVGYIANMGSVGLHICVENSNRNIPVTYSVIKDGIIAQTICSPEGAVLFPKTPNVTVGEIKIVASQRDNFVISRELYFSR